MMSVPQATLAPGAPAPVATALGTDLRKWTALKATVASADFVGIEGLTVSVQTLAVLVNQKSGTLGNGTVAVPNSVYADFSPATLMTGRLGQPWQSRPGPAALWGWTWMARS